MKKHKILFAACVALFASICFLGCNHNPKEKNEGNSSQGSESNSGESDEKFTLVSEFKPAAGAYSFEEKDEKPSYSSQKKSTLVIDGTDDNSKVKLTYSSMTEIHSSEDDYKESKENSKAFVEYLKKDGCEVDIKYDDKNYTITFKVELGKESLENSLIEMEMTYSEFVSDYSSSSNNKKVEIYYSNKGNLR